MVLHELEHRQRGAERALQVNADHRVPLLLGHLGEGAVTQDAGVVDENVDLAERLDRVVEQGFAARDRADVGAVGDRLAAAFINRVGDLLCHGGVLAGAVAWAAEVIDDDGRAFACKQLCVGSTEAAASAGDDRDFLVEQTHFCSPNIYASSVLPFLTTVTLRAFTRASNETTLPSLHRSMVTVSPGNTGDENRAA